MSQFPTELGIDTPTEIDLGGTPVIIDRLAFSQEQRRNIADRLRLCPADKFYLVKIKGQVSPPILRAVDNFADKWTRARCYDSDIEEQRTFDPAENLAHDLEHMVLALAIDEVGSLGEDETGGQSGVLKNVGPVFWLNNKLYSSEIQDRALKGVASFLAKKTSHYF